MKKFILLLILILIPVISYFLFFRNSQKSIEVEKITLETIEVAKTVVSSGEVAPNQDYEMAFQSGGTITSLTVKKGDQVKKNQLLASAISNSNYNDIKALRDTLDIAKRDKDIYVQNYDLERKEVGGDKEYALNLRRLDEFISRANANYYSALNSLSNLNIVSPMDGTVVEVLKKQNEIAIAGQVVLRIADLNDLVFKTTVDQEDFGIIKIGQDVEIVLDSYKDTVFKGKVSKLPLFANPSGDFELEISVVPQPNTSVLLGMTGDAEIKVESTNNKVDALPFDVISEDEKGKFVWIDVNSSLSKKYIETGLEGDFYTQILTDLNKDTLVVPTDDTELKEGLKVKYAKGS